MVRSFTLLLALIGLALPAASLADTHEGSAVLSRIVTSKTLRVGMSGSQPPLNFKNKSGEMMGLEVDLAEALAELMQAELQIVQKPFGELLGALAAGEVDLVMSGMTITPERNLRSAFVGPYYLSGKSILTRSSSLAQADEASDLDVADLKIAALAGSTSEEFVRKVLPKASLTTTPDYDAAVAMLLEDEVGVLVADREAVALTAFLHPKENLASLRDPLTIEPIGIAVPPGDALLVNFLENTMGALETSGLMSMLRSRWTEQSDWIQQLP